MVRFQAALVWVLSATLLASAGFAAEVPLEKAVKYHEILVRRPSPGYLFDRFYNAWLDESTVEALEAFLVEREKSGVTGDALLLAYFHAKQGDDLRAIEQFRKALAGDPGNAAAWYEKAVVEARTLDLEAALADLKRAADAKPDDKLAIQIAKLRGRLLVQNNRKQDAISAWQELLTDRPDDEDLAEDVIELQIDEGLLDEAIALSQSLIERTKDPYKKVLRELRLGATLEKSGKKTEAVATYRATLQNVGADSWLEREVLSQIERTLRRENDRAALRKEYESLLEEFPKRVGVHRAYARLLSEAGESREAIERFREILKLTPGDRANQEAFIALFVQANDFPSAIEQLESLIEQHPRDGELLVNLAQLQGKAVNQQAASEAVDRFLKVSDKSEYAYLRAARLLEQLELPEAAKEKYAALVVAFPASVAAKEEQATFLYQIGEKEAAIAAWRELASDTDAQQLVRMARALATRNEHDVAYEILVSRHDEFSDDSLFLGQLIAEAIATKKYAEAVPWAVARVETCKTSAELSDAVAQAGMVIERADQVLPMIRKLQEGRTPSLRESCLIAELFEVTSDSHQADSVLRPWVEKGEPLAVMQQSRLATRRHDWAAAADAMRRLIDLPGERNSQNVRRLIECYERDFRLEEALKWVVEWKKLSPGSMTPWLAQSRLQLLSGKEGDAIETLRQAAKEFDGNEEIRLQLAQLYNNMGKHADAQRIYWQQFDASESLSDRLRYVDQLAKAAQEQGNLDQLVQDFEERRRNNRDSIEPLLALATIYRVTGDYEKRRDTLAEVAKLKPEDLDLLHEIARIEEQEGDWERAKATLEGALALDKTSRTRQKIARLHLQYGDPDEGFAMLYQRAEGQKTDPRDIEGFADALIAAGDWERARELLATHVPLHPNDYRLRFLLAVAHEEEGEMEAAVDEFIAAMQIDAEISGVTAGTNVASNEPYMAQLAELLPPEAIDLVRLQQARALAYRYRTMRARASVGTTYSATVGLAAGGQSGAQVALFNGIEQSRQFALMHIFNIARFMDAEEQSSLLSRLRQIGIPNAEMLMAFVSTDGRTPPTAEVLEKFSDNDAVRAAILTGFTNSQNGAGPEFYRESYHRFEKSHAPLAALAILQGGGRHAELSDLFTHLPELLDRVEKPSSVLVMQFCNYLRQFDQTGRFVELSPEIRKAVGQKLVEWLPHVRNQQPYGSYTFTYAANALAQSGDAETFVRLLEDELTLHRTGMASQQQLPVRVASQSLTQLPTFPPAWFADFPASVHQVLGQFFSRRGQLAEIVQGRQGEAVDGKQFGRLLPTIKDPILRILVAAQLQDDEVVDETLAKLLAQETVMLDASLLGAARAVQKEQYEEALRLYDKARTLPMKPEIRRQVDRATVAIVMDQLEAFQENPEIMQSARDAALRLRRGITQTAERNQLIAALENLGLAKEAELLSSQPAVAGGSTVAVQATLALGGTPTRSRAEDPIRKLIDDGKKEVAARLLANEVRSMVQQAGVNSSNWNTMQRQLQQINSRLEKYDLSNQVINEIDPGDSTNARKWFEFGLVNEAIHYPTAARSAYERAVELRPRDDAIRTRLVMLLAISDPGAALSLCDKFSRFGTQQLVNELLSRLSYTNDPLEGRLDLADFSRSLFDQQSKLENVELGWGLQVCNILGTRMSARNMQLPSLYAPALNREYDQVPAGMRERRQELHDELCREMLKHPSTAEEAFSLLLASCESREELDDSFADLARDTLLNAERSSQAGSVATYRVYSAASSAVSPPSRTAGEYLVRHCFQKEDWSALDEVVVPHLKKASRGDLVEEIEQYRKLFTCPPNEFEAVVEEFVRESKRRVPQQLAQFRSREPEQLACEAWELRKLDGDLQALVLNIAEQSKRNGTGYSSPSYLLRHVQRLAKEDNLDAAYEFYKNLTGIYLGPIEKRDLNNLNSVSNIQYRATFAAVSRSRYPEFDLIVRAGLAEPRLLEPTLRVIIEEKLEPLVPNYDRNVQTLLRDLLSAGKTDEAVIWLERLGFLGEQSEFIEKALKPSGNRATMLSSVCLILNAYDADGLKARIREIIKQRQPQTLGTRILLAELDDSYEQRFAVMEQLAGEMEAINQLKPEDAGRLGRFLANYPTKPADSTIPDSLKPLLEWIEKHAAAPQRVPRTTGVPARILRSRATTLPTPVNP